MENCIRNWKINRHIKHMKYQMNTLLSPKSFEDLAICLKNNEIIKTFKSREILVSFMIQLYPDIVLGNSLFDYYLQNYAKTLVNSYRLLCTTGKKIYYHHYFYYAEKFIIYFKKWKNQDQYRILIPLLREYYSITQTIAEYENKRPDIVKGLYEIREKIIDKIKRVYQGDINRLIKEYVDHPETIDEVISLDFHNKFWRNFYHSIQNNDYSQVPNILSDIIKKIKDIIPNRTDIHNELSETIDIIYIKQLIDNGLITNDDTKNYIFILFNIIKNLQSASEDNDTNQVMSIITDMFHKQFDTAPILTFSFSTILKKLDHIEVQLSQILPSNNS